MNLKARTADSAERQQWMADRKAIWVRRNRGLLTSIAGRIGVTVSQVSAVLYGKWPSKDGKVEAALIQAGAPGVKMRKSRVA